MGFDAPEYLQLFWLLPAVGFFYLLSWMAYWRWQEMSKKKLYQFQVKLPSWFLRFFKAFGYCFALSLIVLALADPYYQKPVSENIYKGVRVYFLVDISNSMESAEDVLPNRLTATKKEIENFCLNLEGDYEFAVIPFASDASSYYFTPAVSKPAFIDAVRELDGDLIFYGGTDLITAFLGLKEMVDGFGFNKEDTNLVVLLSDGGKEEAFAINRSELQQAIGNVVQFNFKIYTFGVGGLKPAPLVERGDNGEFISYLKDEKTGKRYYSVLDEGILQSVAGWGGGKYFRFENPGDLNNNLKNIIEENRQLKEVRTRYEKTSLRFLFLCSAIIIFILGRGK